MTMKMRPIKKWIAVQTEGLGKEKTTEQGIIYTEKLKSKYMWSVVKMIGDTLTEDIQVGDKVLWDITKGLGKGYGSYDLIHQDWIVAVDREEE
jgi:co-chaperonin GroES (HSP10)